MAEVRAADDGFEEGASPYGSYLVGYLGFLPNTTEYQDGTLYSPIGFNGVAFFSAKSLLLPEDHPIGVMRREEFPEDSYALMTSFIGGINGSLTSDAVYRQGVAVRIQGGTLGGDKTAYVRRDNSNCYTLEVVRQSAFAFALEINRYVGGSRTTLATSIDFAAIGNSFLQGNTMRLSAVDDGSGGVDLVGSIAGLQTVQFLNDTIQVTANDSSGSKITGAGRCGMILDRERNYLGGSISVVSGAVVFEVGDPDTGAVSFRDEFSRAFVGAGTPITSKFGFPGFSLASDYSLDGQSAQSILSGTPDNVTMKRDNGNDRIIFSDDDTSNRKLFALGQRLADDPRVAHREVVARFDVIGPTDISAGLLVRGSTNGADVGGYQLRLFPGLAGAGYIHLIRSVIGQNDTQIAILEGLTLAASTPHRIALEVYPRDGEAVDGPAVLKVYLEGVQQILITEVTDGSVQVLASGDVIDQGQAAITSGSIEGMRVSTGSVINTGIILDTYSQLSLNGAEEKAEDLPLLIIRDEKARKSGTLTLQPDWDVVLVDNQRGDIMRTCAGGQIRQSLETAVVRQLQMRKVVDQADRDTYEQFFDDHKGAEIPFDFDPSGFLPFEPAGVFRFIHGEFDNPWVSPGQYSIRMDVEEIP